MANATGKTKEFNGYDFDEPTTRRRIRYVVIKGGDLDLNGAYGFKNRKDLDSFLEDDAGIYRNVQAVFKVQDITQEAIIK